MELKSLSDVRQDDGMVNYLSSIDKLERRIRDGWSVADVFPYRMGSDRIGILLKKPVGDHELCRFRAQVRNDLISASLGVDDGKDLARYVDAKNILYWRREIGGRSLFSLLREKWGFAGPGVWGRLVRFFCGDNKP